MKKRIASALILLFFPLLANAVKCKNTSIIINNETGYLFSVVDLDTGGSRLELPLYLQIPTRLSRIARVHSDESNNSRADIKLSDPQGRIVRVYYACQYRFIGATFYIDVISVDPAYEVDVFKEPTSYGTNIYFKILES